MNTSIATSIVASLAVVSAAAADFTDVSFTGVGASQYVDLVSPGLNGNVEVGQLLVNLSNSTGGSGYLDGNHIAFCADVYHMVSGAAQTYEIVPLTGIPDTSPMGAAEAQALADIYSFAAGAQYGMDADYAVAFQLAIWEIIHDLDNLDISSGNFQASGLTAGASAALSSLLGAVGTNGSAQLIALTSGQYQDLIIEVPAPGALALLGLAGLTGRRRARRA